jgi:hypothetical protein
MSLRVYYEVLNQKGSPALFTDTLANRPAFGFQGRLFISTDTAQIYEDTGTAWTLIADATGSVIGFVPYSGAINDLNLGSFDITADLGIFNQVKAVGSGGLSINANSGTQVALFGAGGSANITFYGALNGTSGAFSGALNSNTITTSGFISIVTNTETSARFFVQNTGTGGGQYSLIAGNIGVDNVGFGIAKIGTGNLLYFNSSNAASFVSSVTATSLIKSGGTASQYLMADGSVTTLTNPVTGTGTTNTLPKFTGASSLGNSNISDSGTIITLGSTTFISSGSFGIGTGIIDSNLSITKNITGSGGNPNGIYQNSTIQSDATGSAYVNRTLISTQAASFTLVNLNHYYAEQGTFGAGSTVTTQTGFYARSSLIGATNNYGFRGQIPSGTNRWNLYMDGTANNYVAGSLAIGSTSITGINLFVAKNITGSAAAYGVLQQGVVQSDVTGGFGFYNQLNTQAASFTTNYSHFLAVQNSIGAGSVITTQVGYNVASNLTSGTNNYGFRGQIPSGTNRFNLFLDGTANNFLAGNTGIGSQVPNTLLSVETSGTQSVLSPIITSQTSTTTYTGLYSVRDGAGDQRGLAFQVYTANIGLGEKMRLTHDGDLLINTTTDNGQGKLQNSGQSFTGGLGIGGLTFSTNTTASVNTSFYFFNGGAGVTLTLPDTNGQSMIYYIKNNSSSPLTIGRTGTNTFIAAGTIITATSLTLASGVSATIIGNGTTNYIQIN